MTGRCGEDVTATERDDLLRRAERGYLVDPAFRATVDRAVLIATGSSGPPIGSLRRAAAVALVLDREASDG